MTEADTLERGNNKNTPNRSTKMKFLFNFNPIPHFFGFFFKYLSLMINAKNIP